LAATNRPDAEICLLQHRGDLALIVSHGRFHDAAWAVAKSRIISTTANRQGIPLHTALMEMFAARRW
jgi:hypothetical protein